ncbi:MAG: AAA family ATPase [Anaerolineales bacterium]|nr:AAA family ATPase [Anaerolineales bacterium]
MLKFYISPSRIARFFYHECDRYLRYHATPAKGRKTAGIPPVPWNQSPVGRAILDGGYEWERHVIQKKLKKVNVADGTSALHERAFPVEESLQILRKLKPGESIYQPTLSVSENFPRRYGVNPDLCSFPECRPDLIECIFGDDGKPLLRVVDIKASESLKTSHQIQATMYAMMLKDILAENAIAIPVDAHQAGIWLYERDEPEWFDIGMSMGILDRFLRDRLVRILTDPLYKVPWHLYYRCEWCEYYPYCREEAEKASSVSLIPHLTVGGRNFLRDAPWNGGSSVETIGEFERLLSRKDRDEILNACGSLKGQGSHLLNTVQALKTHDVIPHGSSSLALPINEDVRIVLTLQSDPLSGKIYAAGFKRFKGKSVFPETVHEEVFVARTSEECVAVRDGFLKALYKELSVVDAYNRIREWREQKSVQAYVFDGFELTYFNQMLREALEDKDLAEIALKLLFHFQDTSLAGEEEHPKEEVYFPVIVLTHVIRQLTALPIALSYRLPEVLDALPGAGSTYKLQPRDLFWFNLSNVLKSDAIYLAWHRGRTEAAEWVEKELSHRLSGTHNVVDGLREKVKERLFAWPRKFLFPASLAFKHPELSRLSFIATYESFMGAMKIREARTRPWAERLLDGTSIPLRFEGGNQWKVLSELDASLVEAGAGPPDRVLVPKGEEGERAQMGYDDYRNRAVWWAPKGIARLATIIDRKVDPRSGLVTRLNLNVISSREQSTIRKGEETALHVKYNDFTSDRILKCLESIDSRPGCDFLNLLRKPEAFATQIKENGKTAAAAIRAAERARFTPSQGVAFQHMLKHRLTLVWGPPGTGKTHFLAKAVLSLAKARKEIGEPLRVGIMAFTHAAIENLLAEITGHAMDFGLQEILLKKLKRISTPRGEGLEIMGEAEVGILTGEDLWIVGGTVYSFEKVYKSGRLPGVDLLIVDEASQMKFGELALGINALAKVGRLVMAGDDLQLPPIIQGEYPSPEDGSVGLHESVFAYLRAGECGKRNTHQLKENWRMNETLCRFPAETLYGLDYKPATEKVGVRKIRLLPPRRDPGQRSEESAFLDWFIDPEYQMVVGILDNVQASAENPVEAGLVARIAVELRERFVPEGKKDAHPPRQAGDYRFWRESLFIVSPHHVQIRSIHQRLATLRDWESVPFVDTVDKMQGQQAETVIVSYGVSDIETAMSEAEFIYSLNRINVSTTRARAKCIVFLSRPLLEPSYDLLQNEKASKGLHHMISLIRYCEDHGETRQFSLDFLPEGVGKIMTAVRCGWKR